MASHVIFSMVVIILCVFCAIPQTKNIITVDQFGMGDYNKIQDAIYSVPRNNTENVVISIMPGVYKETITVDRPFITLSGITTNADDVKITWNEHGDIDKLATFHVLASDFTARYVTFQNTFNDHQTQKQQAVALRVSGDRSSFYDCSIIGYQDTLLDEAGRHYYEKCYIQGVVHFIFCGATSLYQDCHIHSSGQGYITAQDREAATAAGGFVFFRGWITGAGGKTILGRPWKGSYAKVIFAYTYMDDVIDLSGWDHWKSDVDDLMKNSFCGQFKCEGPGATTLNRVKWARDFTEDQVKPFLTTDFINGKQDWLKPPTPQPTPPLVKPSATPSPEKLPPLPPPPSTMPVIISLWLTPETPMSRGGEEGEPLKMYYYSSGASSLFNNGFVTLALTSAVLLYLLLG